MVGTSRDTMGSTGCIKALEDLEDLQQNQAEMGDSWASRLLLVIELSKHVKAKEHELHLHRFQWNSCSWDSKCRMMLNVYI